MMSAVKQSRSFILVLQILLMLTITQQIYWPQEYKYLHLAVLFVRMLMTEMYQQDYRLNELDKWFIPAIFMTTAVSIIENFANVQLSIIYLVSLLAAIYLLLMMVGRLISDSRQDDVAQKMHPKHIEVLEKGHKFTFGVFYFIYATVLGAFVYTFYVIIQILIS